MSLSLSLIVLLTALQGVINQYHPVVEVDRCRNYILVSDTSHRLDRDSMVIVIQMKGASTDSCGSVASMGMAGRFERNVVERVNGDTIFFRYNLLTSYDPTGSVQVVTMPRYDVVRTSDVLRPKAWDGSTGGVLALNVRDTLYLDSSITASGAGFRAHEGIAGLSPAVSRRYANAGGSTSGGAHVGCGGRVGPQQPCPTNGEAISYSAGVNWIFMGGGGSANGGGIVIIDAPVIIGSGRAVISSDGDDGNGGGAGGALLITASTLINIPELSVRGGASTNGGGGGGGAVRLGTISPLNLNPSSYAGGSSALGTTADGCSGGLYYNVTINESSGVHRPASVVTSPDTSACVGASLLLEVEGALDAVWMIDHDTVATSMQISHRVDSTVRYTVIARYAASCWDTLTVAVAALPPPSIDLGPDVDVCPNTVVTLTAPNGYAQYSWSTGDTTQEITVSDSGIYRCQVMTDDGCEGVDSVRVTYTERRSLSIVEAPTNDIYIAMPTVTAGGITSRTITVVNNADTTTYLGSAVCSANTVFSIPLAQFPIMVPARTTRPLTIVAAPPIPGEHSDKVIINDPCGDITFFVKVYALETEWVTRCGVRITSEGELQGALIRDMLGRIVQEPLSPGIYHVVTDSWQGLVFR